MEKMSQQLILEEEESLAFQLSYSPEKVEKNSKLSKYEMSLVIERQLDDRFSKLLLEAIDEVLASLGEPVRNTLYFRLKNNFDIEKSEIPEHLDRFMDIMHIIFGSNSYRRFEKKILKNLDSKIDSKNDRSDYLSEWSTMYGSFREGLENLRQNLE